MEFLIIMKNKIRKKVESVYWDKILNFKIFEVSIKYNYVIFGDFGV